MRIVFSRLVPCAFRVDVKVTLSDGGIDFIQILRWQNMKYFLLGVCDPHWHK